MMYKISKYGVLVLSVISVILYGGLMYSDSGDSYIFPMFSVSYILLVLVIIAVLAFGALNLLSSPQKTKKTLVYTGVFVAIIAVSYLLSSGKNTVEKWVGTGITAFFILAVIATGLMIFSSIKETLAKS